MNTILVLAICVAAAWLLVHCVRDSQRLDELRIGFSPQAETTDTEFCDLMPDVDPSVALAVRRILSDVSGWEHEEIHPDTRIIEFELR